MDRPRVSPQCWTAARLPNTSPCLSVSLRVSPCLSVVGTDVPVAQVTHRQHEGQQQCRYIEVTSFMWWFVSRFIIINYPNWIFCKEMCNNLVWSVNLTINPGRRCPLPWLLSARPRWWMYDMTWGGERGKRLAREASPSLHKRRRVNRRLLEKTVQCHFFILIGSSSWISSRRSCQGWAGLSLTIAVPSYQCCCVPLSCAGGRTARQQ